jgi:hypothetical protein
VARTALSKKCVLRTLEPSSLTVDQGRSRHCDTARVANHWSSTDAGAPRNHDRLCAISFEREEYEKANMHGMWQNVCAAEQGEQMLL